MFKKAEELPKILIVTDKLLTGYDAPILYCMYLDKPMRDHVLLQAIARVNRPYPDPEGGHKRIGLVVDFVGVLRDLRAALQFDSSDVSGAIEGSRTVDGGLSGQGGAREEYLPRCRESRRGRQAGGRHQRSTTLVPAGADRLLEHYRVHPLPRSRGTEGVLRRFQGTRESLWEILSPSAELRDHIDAFKRLTHCSMRLCATPIRIARALWAISPARPSNW